MLKKKNQQNMKWRNEKRFLSLNEYIELILGVTGHSIPKIISLFIKNLFINQITIL